MYHIIALNGMELICMLLQITYHVVKVNQSDSNVRNRIKRKLEEIEGKN